MQTKTSTDEENPWRFFSAEHLWNKLSEATEKRQIAEQRLYLYESLVSYYMERDLMMERLAHAETDSVQNVILDNVSFINDQIDELLIHLEIKGFEYNDV
jgi:hypothetical protein